MTGRDREDGHRRDGAPGVERRARASPSRRARTPRSAAPSRAAGTSPARCGTPRSAPARSPGPRSGRESPSAPSPGRRAATHDGAPGERDGRVCASRSGRHHLLDASQASPAASMPRRESRRSPPRRRRRSTRACPRSAGPRRRRSRSCAISAAVRGTAGISLRTSRSPSTRASRFTRSAAMLQTAPRASSGMASSFVVMPAIFSRTSGRKTSPSRGTIATITADPPPNVRLISLYTATYGWVCGS